MQIMLKINSKLGHTLVTNNFTSPLVKRTGPLYVVSILFPAHMCTCQSEEGLLFNPTWQPVTLASCNSSSPEGVPFAIHKWHKGIIYLALDNKVSCLTFSSYTSETMVTLDLSIDYTKTYTND